MVSCTDSVRDLRCECSGFAEAEVAAGVADDQVIEQRHVEDVGRLRQPKRESRIVRAWCGIAARMHASKESDDTHATYRVAAFQTFLSGRI